MPEDLLDDLLNPQGEDGEENGTSPSPPEGHPHDDGIIEIPIESDSSERASDRFHRLLYSNEEEIPSQHTPAPPPSDHTSAELAPEADDDWKTALEGKQTESDPGAEADRTTRPPQDIESQPPPEESILPFSSPTPPAPITDQDEYGLPRRVPESDLSATRVGPSAFVSPSETPPEQIEDTTDQIGRQPGCKGCLLRMAILSLFASIAVVIGVISFGLYQYFSLAATLPPVDDIQSNAAQFETTHIYDREGNLLYEILDPHAGRRTYVSLDEISPYMVAAVVATEDAQFYSNPGYDLLAIARAIIQNYQEGEIVSGASTITQQIARNLLFSPEERSQLTAMRKTREILLAAEVTRRYTKDEILELYLNQVYFGNLAYGVQAAAETYFRTTADKLTLEQAAFLAGLIQAPSVYDVYTNRDATLARQQQVLVLMIQASSEQGCIYVSNSQQPVCVTPEDAGRAAAELTNYEFFPPDVQILFPHWVFYIHSELERMYDPQTIYRSGFKVYTTLDPFLQQAAQNAVQAQISTLADRHVTNGALIALRPKTGEILAMVGSADYENEEIDGMINMAIQPRQPGSSIKPLSYTAAFEKGWTPSTLIWDVESEFPPSGNPEDPREPYIPNNYDERFHGPVTARSALANSYNIPAVKTLDFVGIYDDPNTPQEDGLVSLARRMGITTFTRGDYGLALTLGGGDVTLLELTAAYAIFANGGVRVPPVGILRIEDHSGKTVYEFEPPPGEQVIRPEHAYLITSILSDNVARTPAFGANSMLRLPFPAAAKTGTTNYFIDNWTLGFTPELAVGVWVGNADYSPMENTSGLTGAAPIWNQFMNIAVQTLTAGQYSSFTPPPNIVDRVVCAVSGAEPSEWCPTHRTEIFAADQPPLPKEQDLWRKVWVDSYSLELASEECADFAIEKLGLYVSDPWAREWLDDTSAGKEWAEEMGFDDGDVFFTPEETCTADSPRPILALVEPPRGAAISSDTLEIYGKAAATSLFKNWTLYYGTGYNPGSWTRIERSETPHKQVERLTTWDITGIPNGPITLRLVIRSTEGGKAELRSHLTINRPTPTPTPTPTIAPTSTPTLTLPPTYTLIPSDTPTTTLTPSSTSVPP